MKVLRGVNWAKIVLVFDNNIKTFITLSKTEKMVFDIISDFTPMAKNADFYLKVESDIQSPSN